MWSCWGSWGGLWPRTAGRSTWRRCGALVAWMDGSVRAPVMLVSSSFLHPAGLPGAEQYVGVGAGAEGLPRHVHGVQVEHPESTTRLTFTSRKPHLAGHIYRPLLPSLYVLCASVSLRVSVWWKPEVQGGREWRGPGEDAPAAYWSGPTGLDVLASVGPGAEHPSVHRRAGWPGWIHVEVHCQVAIFSVRSIFKCT